MKNPFYKAGTISDMTPTQKRAFERSYKSYEKRYNSLKNPFDKNKLSEEEYLEEYKYTRRLRVAEGLDTKSLPREIAKGQQYERSAKQDEAMYKALKESDVFKSKYGEHLSKKAFRELSTEEIEVYLFGEIKANKEQLRQSGMSEEDVNEFISSYYFGSP